MPPFKFGVISLLGFSRRKTSNVCKVTEKSNLAEKLFCSHFLMFLPVAILRKQALRVLRASTRWRNSCRAWIWDMLEVYRINNLQLMSCCSSDRLPRPQYLGDVFYHFSYKNRKNGTFFYWRNTETKMVSLKRVCDALPNGLPHGRIGRETQIPLIGLGPSHP